MKPGDLAAGNSIIDDAVEEAGRTAGDVRRLVNISGRFMSSGGGFLQGPAEQWVAELTDFALSDGISGFILGSDDRDDLRRFTTEVAPAVRELVAAERSRPSPSATPTAATQPAAPASNPMPRTAGAVPRGRFTVVPTPDDGLRRSAEQPWEESTRPTGPAPDPDPDRTYTAHEQATGQHLIEVHNMLRAELAQIYDLIEQVAAGTIDVGSARSDINTMTMRQNKWTLGTYCESYCRIVTTHHSLEDQALFPGLRRADPRLAPIIDHLEHEHHVIHDVLEGVDRALVAFVAAADGVPELRAAVDALSDSLLSHLAYEERQLVEPLARLGMR